MPSTRQIRDSERGPRSQERDPAFLVRAFATFTEAAGSLEKSYLQLQSEVAKLRGDLEFANARLSRSLEETARAREFLTQVLDRLPCGVMVSRADGEIPLVNPEARRLLGLETNAPARMPEWMICLIPGTSCIEHEIAIAPPKDKRQLAVSVTTMQALVDAQPETIWILRDVSDQKRLAAEREENKRAHALAEIATVLAHEIRNPLASMELFSRLLGESTRLSPEAHQWVLHLQSGLRSLGATVNNVLQFHGNPPHELLPVRLDRTLRHVAEFLRPLASVQGLSISFENLPGAVTVAADPNCLQQAFFNIALNAFRAMSDGGKLTIRLEWAHFESRLLRIDFQDEGRGIKPELLEKIFEPGVSTKPGSPGLGLSVSRRVIEQHGGTVQVQSELNQGSTFSIYLRASEQVCE